MIAADPHRLVVLDVDGTLYPADSGLIVELQGRIRHLMTEATGLTGAAAEERFTELRRRYCLVLLGLHVEHGGDLDEMLRYAHDIDYDRHLRPVAGLAEALAAVDVPVVAFSNSPRAHVERVLELLEISRWVDRAVTLEDFAPSAKPFAPAFEALRAKTATDFEDMVLFEDSDRNAAAARALGIRVVPIGDRAGAAPVRFASLVEGLRSLPPAGPQRSGGRARLSRSAR